MRLRLSSMALGCVVRCKLCDECLTPSILPLPFPICTTWQVEPSMVSVDEGSAATLLLGSLGLDQSIDVMNVQLGISGAALLKRAAE